jgi:hypothetical protein
MARYPLVSTATIVLTNPAAGPLLTAREALENAETSFYRSRRNLVNSYPMKTRDITTEEIESLYDTYLGAEPWRYRNRFNNSNSTLKTGSYGNTGDGFFTSETHREFYVEPWGDTPTGTYPITVGGGFSGSSAFLYDGERGAAWVDLIVQYGYNNGFSRRGGTRTGSQTSGAGDGATTTVYTVYEGFGELPVAYNGRGGLSDFEAHMLKLVGDAYEDEVRSALNNYTNSLNSYQGSNGSPTEAGFDSNNVAQPWEGFTGVEGAYNRPERLNADLVRETRGTS